MATNETRTQAVTPINIYPSCDPFRRSLTVVFDILHVKHLGGRASKDAYRAEWVQFKPKMGRGGTPIKRNISGESLNLAETFPGA